MSFNDSLSGGVQGNKGAVLLNTTISLLEISTYRERGFEAITQFYIYLLIHFGAGSQPSLVHLIKTQFSSVAVT